MANPLKNKFWQQLSNNSLLRFLLLFGCGCAIVFLIQYFYSVIVMFTIAATFAALLNFPVQWLSRYVPRPAAIAIVCLTSLGAIILFVSLLGLEVVNQGQGLASNLFNFLQTTNLDPVRKFLTTIDVGKVIDTLRTGLLSGVGFLQGVFSNFLTAVFVIVICIYMLIDGDRIWNTCLSLLPVHLRDRFGTTFQRSFVGFFRAQFILVGFLAASSFVGFTLFQVKYALFLCLILGLIDLIPGIGGTLCVIVVTLLVLMSQGWQMAVWVFIVSTVLQQIQDNLISPKVMKEQLEINPVLLFFALFIGERIAGLLGIFISIPLTGMIVSLLKEPSPTTVAPLKEKQSEDCNISRESL